MSEIREAQRVCDEVLTASGGDAVAEWTGAKELDLDDVVEVTKEAVASVAGSGQPPARVLVAVAAYMFQVGFTVAERRQTIPTTRE